MKVPFLNLAIQNKKLNKEINIEIKNISEESSFVLGNKVTEFEENFAKYCNSKYCIGLNSGTDALKFALIAAGVKENDEVITVPNTFIATSEVITQLGAKIVFVDIDKQTYTIDVNKIEGAITPKTKVILPVHLYGQCVDMDKILQIAEKYNLLVIEDCCQAHGAKYKNKIAGNMGIASAFSFYPGKNLGAWGDGGCLITNDSIIYDQVKKLSNHGQSKKYFHDIEGYNSRLDTIQAAILNIKLKHLNEYIEKRRENAIYYNKLLKDYVIIPYEPEYSLAVYHLYVIQTKNRNNLQKKLLEDNIQTLIHYPIPLHLQKAYNFLGYKEDSLPIAEKASKNILSLPMFPELTKKQIEYVAKKIIKHESKKI